jgi:hypothetical protein
VAAAGEAMGVGVAAPVAALEGEQSEGGGADDERKQHENSLEVWVGDAFTLGRVRCLRSRWFVKKCVEIGR